jgi:hypothetical protein
MREKYMSVFDKIWVDNLHGDRIISEYAPDGKTSETIFSIQGTSPGIKIGTAIALLCRKSERSSKSQVFYRDVADARAADRRAALLQSLSEPGNKQSYIGLEPVVRIGLPFKPRATTQEYFTWPLLPNVLPSSFPGVQSSRDDLVVDTDRDRLVKRMMQYFNPQISNEEIGRISPIAMRDTARFEASKTREYLVRRGFVPENIVPHLYRPFDLRWLYWESETKLLDEKRADYFAHVSKQNIWLVGVQQNRRSFDPPIVTSRLGSRHLVERGANLFPLLLVPDKANHLFEKNAAQVNDRQLNLSEGALKYLRSVGRYEEAAFLFHHLVAILHAPAYAIENAGALRQDWPRIPLPSTKDALLHSADLGRKIAALLDTEQGVDGVTAGAIGDPFRYIGTVSHVAGKPLDPIEDLKVTAGWGHAGKGGVTMPGKGKIIERDYSTDERKAIERSEAIVGAGLVPARVDSQQSPGGDEPRPYSPFALLGESTYDVYLNDVAYWKGIPARVWDYTIGGYQVIKKWLSYREFELLNRPLTPDEAREVMNMARRISTIVLLEPALDANYRAVKDATYSWPGD